MTTSTSASPTGNRGPVDATVVPRYGGPATFARLPQLDEVERALRQRFPSIKRVIGHAEPTTAAA